MDEFIGIVKLFAGTFAPQGWAFCDGSLLQIAQNQALFSIVGTVYGGDGRTTFALPDLRGRVALGAGNGPGLSPREAGEISGPQPMQGPGVGTAAPLPANPLTDTTTPFTTLNYIICMAGIYPTRS